MLLICLALSNGVLIAASRAVNGHLAEKIGVVGTALWAHAVGFAFLSLVIASLFRGDMAITAAVPPTAWCGGILGVAFVALNSHAVPRLGAGRTTSCVVGAQMVASLVLDSAGQPPTAPALGGAALVILGVWLAATAARP